MCSQSTVVLRGSLDWPCNILACRMQVMDMLGPSLWDVWNNNSHTCVQ